MSALAEERPPSRLRPILDEAHQQQRDALDRQLDAIIHATRSGTEDFVDAHVVAACISSGRGSA